MAPSTGILNTPGITSGTITNTSFSMTLSPTQAAHYDELLYGRHVQQKTYVAPPAPPIQRERLDEYERMMIGPRPVPDYPIPLFVGDYLNGIFLPYDWDPDGHLEGTNEWDNRTRFFSEGRLFGFKRLPLAPRLP